VISEHPKMNCKDVIDMQGHGLPNCCNCIGVARPASVLTR
jgi:hypothetical protein